MRYDTLANRSSGTGYVCDDLTGQEESARLVVRGDALEKGQSVAHSVGGGRGEL